MATHPPARFSRSAKALKDSGSSDKRWSARPMLDGLLVSYPLCYCNAETDTAKYAAEVVEYRENPGLNNKETHVKEHNNEQAATP